MPEIQSPRSAAIARGWAAAAYGLVEVAHVVGTGRLWPSGFSTIFLIISAIVVTGGLGALFTAVLSWLPALKQRDPRWGWIAGLALPVVLSIGVTWFSDPPPLQKPWPLQGNPIAWLVVGVGLPIALAIGLGALAERSRVAALGVVGVVAAIIWRVQTPEGVIVGPAANHPNLLLVTLDTTRADAFGPQAIHGGGLARVSAGGVRFERAYAQIPVTGPSHATLLLGQPPWEHGLLLNGRQLPVDEPTLAELLSAQGYSTGAFVSAYVLDGKLGYDRGFSVYDDDFRWLTGFGRTLPGRLLEMGIRRREGAAYLLERRGDDTTDRAIAWLRATKPQERPFFAWVHLFDPHGPYTPPPPYDTRYAPAGDPRDPTNPSMHQVTNLAPYLAPSLKGITDVDWVRSQYTGEVAFADAQLERLLETLEVMGVSENTLVVVVGDHGEGLGEHGEWFGHGDALYEEDLHVPLAMRFPGHIAPKTVVSTPVELDDIAPTVLDWLGMPPVPSHHGIDLRVAIESGGPTRPVARAVGLDREANRSARALDPASRPQWRLSTVRDGNNLRVLVREADSAGFSAWRDDEPLTEPHPALVQTLDSLAEDARGLFAAPVTVAPVGGDTRRMLESLGYIEEDP